MSENIRHNDDGLKYFIRCKEGEIVKLLCIVLPKMTGYINYFRNQRS